MLRLFLLCVFLMLCKVCQSFLVVKPDPVLVKVGETATFDCQYDNTKNTIYWYDRKKSCTGNDKPIKIISGGTTGDCSLVLKDVSTNDAKNYFCVEKNGNTIIDEAIGELIILHDDPIVSNTTDCFSQTVWNITFTYNGYDSLYLAWELDYKNGELATYYSTEEKKNGNTLYSIFIDIPKRIKSITYQICGENLGCFPKIYECYKE